MMKERRSVRYFCTAGNGMELFLTEEVKQKLEAEDVHQMAGKVLFTTSFSIDKVRGLKSAERLFLLLKQDSPVKPPAHVSPGKAASLLHSRLLADKNQWTSAAMTWSCLQRKLKKRKNEKTCGSEKQKEYDEKCDGNVRKSSQEETGNETVRRDRENRIPTLEKRKREKEGGMEWVRDVERRREEGMSSETCGAETQTLKKSKKEYDWEKRRGEARESGEERMCERQRKEADGQQVERRDTEPTGKRGIISEMDFCDRGSRQNQNVEECGCAEIDEEFTVENATPGKKMEQHNRDPQPSSPNSISFRISCKCTGRLSRYLGTQEVSQVIGAGVSKLLGWKADLKNPQLEVNVFLSDDYCLLGIPLTRLPLAKRAYIKTTGLRSTVAWAMASLAHIQPGFCVVDPMCGVGTILIEAAQEHQDVCFLGFDNDDEQLQRANGNVGFAELGNRMHLLKASSTALPLPSASVGAVICDLPFGRKFGTKSNMAADLPLILMEMERVLCVGGTVVLLLSPPLSSILKKLWPHEATGPPTWTNLDKEPQIQDYVSASVRHPEDTLSLSKKTEPETGFQHRLPPPLSCLKHQTTLRVSLGAIDGLIHKYVKIDT
ncbi:THUMP domain-containing protein 2 isoform X2 [Thalassophryne amazonica]|uniref:THUMP domain-containing protein 2 isoform X2 n=1 Tax=Thalassophryne amazonica TaxID=390379 RepID=UPI0014724829|nr:THUMP domain-containing protein 2 isoform X2 [Thalassophryne amazonica]